MSTPQATLFADAPDPIWTTTQYTVAVGEVVVHIMRALGGSTSEPEDARWNPVLSVETRSQVHSLGISPPNQAQLGQNLSFEEARRRAVLIANRLWAMFQHKEHSTNEWASITVGLWVK